MNRVGRVSPSPPAGQAPSKFGALGTALPYRGSGEAGFVQLGLCQAGDEPGHGICLTVADASRTATSEDNLVARAAAADLALLVVAANEGWTPRTAEVVRMLTYLGVPRALVVLTKVDLAEGREGALAEAVRTHLCGTPFPAAPILPTSAVRSQGLEELKTALGAVMGAVELAPDTGKPRLPVEGVSAGSGSGIVVTGTLMGGRIWTGQSLVVQPRDQVARLGRIETGGDEVRSAGPGEHVSLSLVDLSPRGDAMPKEVMPGDVIAVPGMGEPANAADVLLAKLPSPGEERSPAARPLADRAQVHVCFGSATVPATVFTHGGEGLVPGGQVLAQLRFDSPVYLFGGDRFVVRDPAGPTVLAGGLVLDPDGNRKHWQHRAHRTLLEARAAAPTDVTVWVASQLVRDGVVAEANLLVKSRFSAAAVSAGLAALAGDGRAVVGGGLAADAGRWRGWLERAAAAVDQVHRAHPEWIGLPLTELRKELGEELELPGAFEALIPALCAAGFVQSREVIRRSTHRPTLPPRLEATANWLREALAEKPLEPPARKELVGDRASQEAMRFLIDTGEAVEVGTDLVLMAGAYAGAVAAVQACLRRQGQATVSELRQAVGCTRRLMVPLCEQLDREGVTQRDGDLRRLGRAA